MISTFGPTASRTVRTRSTFFAMPSRPWIGPYLKNHFWALKPASLATVSVT